MHIHHAAMHGRKVLPDRRRGSPTGEEMRAALHSPARSAQACACGGGCSRCRARSEHAAAPSALAAIEPNDAQERQADELAGRVLRGASVGGSITPSASVEEAQTDVVRSAGRTTGRELPLPVRMDMESAFGRSFGHVRMHDDADAARLSESLHARAFANGADLYFGRGEFSPNTSAGKHLLAHELTHVLQTGGRARGIRRKVVDNDFHVPCRETRAGAVDTIRNDETEGIRICRATAARIQANIAGADPDPAGFAAALLRRFHLDANDPGVREHWLPLLAKRYRIVANAIEQQNHRYTCAAAGIEPSVDCATRPGLAFTAPGFGETDLCDGYWPNSDAFRGGVIAHEWFHMIFEWFGDCESANVDSAECYEMFAREMGGTAGATTAIECCKPPAGTTPAEAPPSIITPALALPGLLDFPFF